MRRHPRQRQGGATLVEIMISMVIGLAIVGGLTQVFVAGRSSYSLQERLGSLQENGRYALYFLQCDIRNAGMPRDGAGIIAFVRPTEAAPNNTADGGGNNPDRIAVRYRATVAGTTDCLGNNIALGTIVVTAYSINVDALTGVSRLMCSAQGAAAQPIVDGIENLQILYGIDRDPDTVPGFGYADFYVPANAVAAADWERQVVSVRVAILSSTMTPIAGDAPADNMGTFVLLNAPPVGPLLKPFPFPTGPMVPLRGRVFNTTIEIRNRTV